MFCCNGCDLEFNSWDEWKNHNESYLPDMSHSGYTIDYRNRTTESQGHYEKTLVKEAWTETIITGYTCSCGAAK